MARLLLTDFETNAALEVPYSQETDLILTAQLKGATKVVVEQDGSPSQTLLVQESLTQIRRREVICLY